VARPLEEFLEIHRIVLERARRLALGQADGVAQARLAVHHAHAAPAAAAGGLDDDGIADGARERGVLDDVVTERLARARHAGHAGFLHRGDGRELVAHQAHGVGARADEDEARFLDALGEVRVLGQETVTRVDGDGVDDLGRGDHGRDVEVAVGR
jgi:hypothetical protein